MKTLWRITVHKLKLMVAGLLAGPALAYALTLPVINPADVVAKYGKPDRVYSAEHEKPRPPLVTQQLDYKKAGVRVLLMADVSIGTPPPYKQWKLLGYQDLKTKNKISTAEFETRMAAKK